MYSVLRIDFKISIFIELMMNFKKFLTILSVGILIILIFDITY